MSPGTSTGAWGRGSYSAAWLFEDSCHLVRKLG